MRGAFLNGVAPIAVQHCPSHREPDYTPVNKQHYARAGIQRSRITSQLAPGLSNPQLDPLSSPLPIREVST